MIDYRMEISLLQQKSKVITQDIYVNSSFRNRNKYPNPNQYTLTLLENFRNVVGADIINPRIPRSEYNVNLKNNKIVFIYDKNDDEEELEVQINPGDYSVDDFIRAFNDLQITFNQNVITMYYLSLQSKLVLSSNIHFKINVKKSTMTKLIGIDHVSTDMIESQLLPSQFESIYIQSYTNQQKYILSEPYKIYTHDFDVHTDDSVVVYYLKNIHIPGIKLRIQDNLTPIIRFRIDIIHKSTQDVIGVSETERLSIFTFENDIKLYNHESYQLRLSFTRVEAFDVSKIEIPVQNNPLFSSSIRTNGFSWIHQDDTHDNIQLHTFYGNDIYGIDMNIHIEKRVYSIIPSGKYSFSGTNEITIRCKELNDHFSNGFINEDNQNTKSFLFGKMITLYDSNHFQDYVPLENPIYFTPVSKLSQLSFSFETIDDELYDCMGLNHSFTMRLYMLHINPNIDIPFQEQVVYSSIEAVNEHQHYFEL